jgi:hypothetical protein
MKLKPLIIAASIAASTATIAHTEGVKVGMITTLSGVWF